LKALLSDAAQPRDAGGLPRGAYVSRDRIVRAVIKGIRAVRREERGRNGQDDEERKPK